jgi:hypothetical protein
MITVRNNKVEFNNPNIVKYFAKYYNIPKFLKSCETVLETFCVNTDDFLQNYTESKKHDQEHNSILIHLQALEQQNDEFKTLIQSSMSSIADDILSKVSTQLTGLILSIDNIVSSSVTKLNVSHITDSLKEFISESFNDTNKHSTKELETYITNHILTPIRDTQQLLLEQLTKIPEHISNSSNHSDLYSKLSQISDKWSTAIDTVILDVKTLETTVDTYVKVSNDSVNKSPLIIKGVLGELVHNLEQQTNNISFIVNNIQKDIHSNATNITLIKSSNDDLKLKLDSLDKQLITKNIKESNSNSFKGSFAEDKLFELLSEQLMDRDHFYLSQVNGLAHSCDILVQRTDFPNIRIECKAHGEHTHDKVRTKEVQKFERDLLELDNHGIFVSIHSDIIGKGSIEINQLHNGKFAIFLSKNNYDIKFIIDMIFLLYKLDKIITTSNSNSNIILTPEHILQIQNIIRDNLSTISNIKQHLKDTIQLVNSISLTNIDTILMGQLADCTPTTSKTTTISCDVCNTVVKNHTGLVAHKRKCNKINTSSNTTKTLDLSSPSGTI